MAKFRKEITSSIKNNIWVFIIGAVFVIVRLINIRTEEFWCDELYSLLIAQKLSFTEVFPYIKSVYHPPFYYWLMRVWLRLFGLSEFTSRLPALGFSLVAFWAFYKSVTELTERRVIQGAGLLLLTFSALNVEYSQEARPYTLMLALFSFGLWRLLRIIKNRNASNWDIFLLTFINLLGLYSHYSYFVYFLGLALALFLLGIFNHPRFWKWIGKALLSFLVSFLGFLPWLLPTLISNTPSNSVYGPLANMARLHPYHLISGMNYFYFVNINFLVEFLSFLGVTLALAFFLVRCKKAVGDKTQLFFVGLCLLISVFLIYISPLSRVYSFTWQRHILILNFLSILLVTCGLLGTNKGRVFGWLLFALLSFTNIFSLPKIIKNDSHWFYNHQHKVLAEYIEENEEKGDLILVPKLTFDIMMTRYYQGPNRVTTAINDFSDENGLPSLETVEVKFSVDGGFKEDRYMDGLNLISSSFQKIWLVSNYAQEDRFALEYFKSKPEWQVDVVDNFSDQRLWRLTKKD